MSSNTCMFLHLFIHVKACLIWYAVSCMLEEVPFVQNCLFILVVAILLHAPGLIIWSMQILFWFWAQVNVCSVIICWEKIPAFDNFDYRQELAAWSPSRKMVSCNDGFWRFVFCIFLVGGVCNFWGG